MTHYAIMRLAKVKTLAQLDGMTKHMERERETPNADPERTPDNERLAGTGDWRSDVEARLALVPTIRSNAVLSIEMMLSASPEWFTAGTQAEQDRRRDAWRDLSVQWVKEQFGAENLVAAVLHRDESTPHLQALVVPIDERGRLNARAFIGGDRRRLAELQDRYAERVAALGLERGVRGSVATHEEVKHWYAQSQEISRDVTRSITAAVEIEPPPTVVPSPQEYARQQQERVVAAVVPRMEALAQQAQQLTFRVERQELQIAAQAEREQMSKALLAHLRQVNLGTVMTALGGEIDRDDPQRWRLNGDLIIIKKEQFHNLTRREAGTGALELVMHGRPSYDFEEAVVFLAKRAGPDIAVVAAARYAQAIAERAVIRAPEVERLGPRPMERAAAYER